MGTPIELHVCSLRSDVDLPVLTGFMMELTKLLAQPPASISVGVHPLDESDLAVISRFDLLKDLHEVATDVICCLAPKYGHARTVILSDGGHPFAVSARQANPKAVWGCASGCV